MSRNGRGGRAPLWVGLFMLVVIAAGFVVVYTQYWLPWQADSPPPWITSPSAQVSPTPDTTASPSAEPTASPPPQVKVKGLYVTGYLAGQRDALQHFVDLCDTTEINALVIDVKDDRGQITFVWDGGDPAQKNFIGNIEQTVVLLKAHNITPIARIVCFKDPIAGAMHPEWALQTKSGGPWRDAGGVTWLSPYSPEACDYLIGIAQHAVEAGFSEVQFDYVRFPSDGNLQDIDYGQSQPPKDDAICDFLSRARQTLNGLGARTSADVFGVTLLQKGDFEGIGQDFERMAREADALSPMIYPSHFANRRQNGQGQYIGGVLFETPDTRPYDVVLQTLRTAAYRLGQNNAPESPDDAKSGYMVDDTQAGVAFDPSLPVAGLRPYLQDFTATWLGQDCYIEYTAEQVRAQIQAVYDAGYDEWILWNASSVYHEDALTVES